MLTKLLFTPDGGVALAPAPAAPAAPSKPAAATAPSNTPAPSSPEPSDDPFQPPPKPPTAPAAKPADGKPATPAPSLADADIDKMAPGPLRQRVKQLNAENQTFAGKVKTLEDKIREVEARGGDTTALTNRLGAIEKERDSALAELRAARQEASPEFIEKFDKPFNRTANSTKSKIEQLQVINPEDQSTRPATWADFTTLYGLPVGKAIEQANVMFGTAAPFVISKLEQLRDMDDARANALQEEKAQFKSRGEKEIAEQAKKRQSVGNLWQQTNKRLGESVEDYKNDPTDTEASEARKHALSVFDESINVTDDDSMAKKITKDAHVRQKVGAYAVQKVVISRLKADNEALKKQIDELKGTAPGSVQRPGGDEGNAAPESDDDWEQAAIREIKSKGG